MPDEPAAKPAAKPDAQPASAAEDGSRRAMLLQNARLGAVILVLVLAVVITSTIAAGCDTPPSKDELTGKAGLLGKRELLIGVKDDQPGTSLRDPRTKQFAGFDIDIAYLVAADLGFRRGEVRFLAIESEDRVRMQAREADGQFAKVDLVIASYSITPQREAQPGVSFAGPYLTTEQSVVTLRGHATVQTLDDLEGKRICTLSTSTSKDSAATAKVKLVSSNRISECMNGLRRKEFDAVSTDATIIAGFVHQDPKNLMHHDIGLDTQETWGINTGGNEALRVLVNHSLYRSAMDPEDQRWEEAFEKHLRPLQLANEPQQVAAGEQPALPRVRLREWPWERIAAGPPATSTPSAGSTGPR